MTTTLYGIKNCDTVKKTRKWLEQHDIAYQFHDVRQDGLSLAKLKQWVKTSSWETLVNKRSTTWKQLGETQRQKMNEASAINAMFEHPTLIKRPVLEHGKTVRVGFNENDYQSLFL